VNSFNLLLGVVKRNPLFFHSISCKNNGFLFTTPNMFEKIISKNLISISYLLFHSFGMIQVLDTIVASTFHRDHCIVKCKCLLRNFELWRRAAPYCKCVKRYCGVAQYFETGPCLRARIYHTQERTNARSEKTPGREISIGFFQRISHVISISLVWTFELIVGTVGRASWSPLVETACCCIPGRAQIP